MPLFELRFSIPVAILRGTVNLPLDISISGFGWPWLSAAVFCVVINMLLGPVVYFGLDVFTRFFLKYAFFSKIFHFFIERSRKKVEKYVRKFGIAGVALFIGVPLPGSGTYSGALGAYVLGLTRRQFYIANIFGVLIAGTLVTILTLTGQGLWQFMTK
jgi:uncharacterized membrane protein